MVENGCNSHACVTSPEISSLISLTIMWTVSSITLNQFDLSSRQYMDYIEDYHSCSLGHSIDHQQCVELEKANCKS